MEISSSCPYSNSPWFQVLACLVCVCVCVYPLLPILLLFLGPRIFNDFALKKENEQSNQFFCFILDWVFPVLSCQPLHKSVWIVSWQNLKKGREGAVTFLPEHRWKFKKICTQICWWKITNHGIQELRWSDMCCNKLASLSVYWINSVWYSRHKGPLLKFSRFS